MTRKDPMSRPTVAEGSCLLPDTRHGLAYIEQARRRSADYSPMALS